MAYKERIPWSMNRVILVTGGRDFTDPQYVWRVMEYHAPDLIVHGGATGVDTFADEWAKQHGIPRTIFAIASRQWQILGKAMGGYRNADMVIYLHQLAYHDEWGDPDWEGFEGIVFPGRSGTENMRRKLEEAGIPWWDYRDGGEPGKKLGRVNP